MSIQRLNPALRSLAKLNSFDARAMHVVSDFKINQKVLMPTRYNVRTDAGDIFKFTVDENSMTVSYLTKSGDYYQQVLKQHICGASEEISAKFAEILANLQKAGKIS